MDFRYLILFFSISITSSSSSDITFAIFGNFLDGLPAAFGDFDSDELTDVFVLTKDLKTLQILRASDQEPLLQLTNLTCSFKNIITSVVPGDYDGDVFMDVLVTTHNQEDNLTHVHLLWGGIDSLNCSNESTPFIKMHGQPLAVDYNQDMVIDLFGLNEKNERTFWINHNRSIPYTILMDSQKINSPLIKSPHSNAFLDLNGDYLPDLMITTENDFEVWLGSSEGFKFNQRISWPPGITSFSTGHVGQALYLDVELKGKLDLVVPICYDNQCTNCTIAVYNNNGWHDLHVDFKDKDNVNWGFVTPNSKKNIVYVDAITLHGGDFNMDGYPDLLATLKSTKSLKMESFLLLNVPCTTCENINRTFEIHWNALNPFRNQTVMAVFYDFYQDGILDVMLVEYNETTNRYRTGAFKNSLDYDANFVKVMVLTGLVNRKYPISPGSLGKKKRTYGTNLPGPSIAYKTTTQDGSPRSGTAAQIPQSAHFSLNLPYTTFGLGRTPNFIDMLTIGVAGKSREWPQIIPNSQMVVIPNPITESSRWKAQLFVTPSKLILLSAAALMGTCGLITTIIIGLYWKERREDKIERLQEAHRFHFDAM
ncbi:T-cell immunomodulatory protein [Chelonus insularis]|uniref:T-cell immunomodulatory protein n=1 Tax=Chelonus insularis TaxID=460826 RepID=UPI00158912BC|nr:T-cell immunomodulatory protein [Chelonus insularis]